MMPWKASTVTDERNDGEAKPQAAWKSLLPSASCWLRIVVWARWNTRSSHATGSLSVGSGSVGWVRWLGFRQFWFGLCWCGCVRCLGRGRRVRCLSSRGLRRATGKQKRCSREPGDDHLHAGTVRHFRSNHRSTTSLPSRMARRSKWVTGRQSGRSITPPVQRPSSSKTSWIACAYCAQSVAMCQ